MKLTRNDQRRLTTAFKRGVKTLNALIPDWRDRINWEEFKFELPSKCIAGQLGLTTHDDYGFNVYNDTFSYGWDYRNLGYKFLENLWKSEKPS